MYFRRAAVFGKLLVSLALFATTAEAQHGYRIDTVAGSGVEGFGGAATAAQLYGPAGVAVDGAGNLYIADERNDRIRKVDSTGTINTVAGTGAIGFSGDGGAAQLYGPTDLNYPTVLWTARATSTSPIGATTGSGKWTPRGRSAPSRAPE